MFVRICAVLLMDVGYDHINLQDALLQDRHPCIVRVKSEELHDTPARAHDNRYWTSTCLLVKARCLLTCSPARDESLDLVRCLLLNFVFENAHGLTGVSWPCCGGAACASREQALLEAKVRVLVYAGEMDYICNYVSCSQLCIAARCMRVLSPYVGAVRGPPLWLLLVHQMGNKAWTMALEWSGKAQFNAAGDHKWMVSGKQAGLARSASGFTFLQVMDSAFLPNSGLRFV